MPDVTNPTPAQFLAALGKSGFGLAIPGAKGLTPIPVISTPPAWDVPYPESVPFMESGTLTAVSVVGPTLVTPTFTMPIGHTGWVRSLVLQALNVSATSSLYFQLQVNGSPVPGWNQITVLPGAFAVWNYTESRITVQVESGQSVAMFVSVGDGNSYQVSAMISGWHIDRTIAAGTDIFAG